MVHFVRRRQRQRLGNRQDHGLALSLLVDRGALLSQAAFENFVVARVTGLYVMTAGTIAFRLLYAGILGTSYAGADILGFAAFAALGFLASSKVMAADSNKIRPWFPAAALALALFIAMYLTFTVNPPHISLFWIPLPAPTESRPET